MLSGDASDYYVAQVIEVNRPDARSLVAEMNGKIVGFISLSQQMNYKTLMECYNLSPYEDFILRKLDMT
jgi:hypothetical protein